MHVSKWILLRVLTEEKRYITVSFSFARHSWVFDWIGLSLTLVFLFFPFAFLLWENPSLEGLKFGRCVFQFLMFLAFCDLFFDDIFEPVKFRHGNVPAEVQ
ncbi:hypothetical protein N7541_007699 [Penicillium brevicompactum]|uniref:Uncharacterized protein n=1 Tax=Penicillium brevicompactum TaxID=5074 RepID=A0A9W9QXN4_PENBR|nr:hypothetical protein N7541_007699 [Penicillium brevicompactum]